MDEKDIQEIITKQSSRKFKWKLKFWMKKEKFFQNNYIFHVGICTLHIDILSYITFLYDILVTYGRKKCHLILSIRILKFRKVE